MPALRGAGRACDPGRAPFRAADENRVYFVKMPVEAGGMSATDFRNTMASDADPKKKAQVFQQFFGKFDQEIFNFIEGRLKQ